MPQTITADMPTNRLTVKEVQQAERIGIFLAETLRDVVASPDRVATRDLCAKVRMLQRVRAMLPDSAGAAARHQVDRDMLDLLESFVDKQPE